MLAKLVRELPVGDYVYEPKWDGFRCLVFSSGGVVDLRSRHQRPLARYFPELTGAFVSLGSTFVVDGEILVPAGEGYDFNSLLQRLHPASSRVDLLSRATPAVFVAFDLLVEGSTNLAFKPFW